jgi:hypothetical protein
MHTNTPFPMKATTLTKWTWFRNGLSLILAKGRSTGSLSMAELRKIAGLGINIMQVYQDKKCYLKGIFNAVEAFRSDQDPDGWHVESSIDFTVFLEYSNKLGLESSLEVQWDYPLETKR